MLKYTCSFVSDFDLVKKLSTKFKLNVPFDLSPAHQKTKTLNCCIMLNT